jgi:SAM-dependent methyltransferase
MVHDLNNPLPFDDDSATEIHAYEVLEHCGTQGDYRFFFRQWSDFWRVLKPGGLFFATVPLPTSPWAWGDPSHTRIIQVESLTFLNQPAYAQVGVTPMSDYRSIYRADFDILYTDKTEHSLCFALKAVKPSRVHD